MVRTSRLDHDLAVRSDRPDVLLQSGNGRLDRAGCAALREMIVLTQVAELEARTLLQIADLDLRRAHIEGLFEARQLLDLLLSEDEAGGGRRSIGSDEHAYLPELQRAPDG